MLARRVRAFGIAALLGSSCLVAPAQAQEYFPPEAPPIRETVDENGVDLARGLLVGRAHGVSIGGPGSSGLGWSRIVTSSGSFRDSAAMYISVSGSTHTVTIGPRSESFTLSGSNYISDQKTGATLTKSSSTYTYTSADGTIFTFRPWQGFYQQYGGSDRVTSVAYPTGEKLTFNYEVVSGICIPTMQGPCTAQTTGERLISVEATNGYKLAFEFEVAFPSEFDDTTAWMNIVKVTALNMSVDPASQSWPYLSLSGVTYFSDALNRTTNYTFTSGSLTGIKRPGASTNNITIGYASGKVSQVTNEGVATNYSYADASGVRTTTISDAVAGNRVVATDLTTMLVSSDTNEASKKTAYEYYTDSGLLKKVTAHEGNSALFEYDGRGNRTKTTLNPKSGTATIVTQASYPPSDATLTWQCASTTPAVRCNKPLTTTDALGYVTNYEWDSTTGELTKVTLPGPTTTAVRPETRYSYSSLYAQYRNTSGVLTNFTTPLKRLTGISACQVNASCAGTADEVKSTIAYGTANVLPISVASGSGDGALKATTGFSYDTVGNRLTVDGPLTGTGDTTRTRFDAARQVVGVVGADPDGATTTLKHRAQRLTYNPDGQVTKAETGTVVDQTDAAWTNFSSLETVDYTYDTRARPTTAKLSSGTTAYALTQTSYDSLGRVDCTAIRMNTGAYGSLPAACTLGTQGSDGPDRISRMSYDAASRPLSVTTGYGTTAAAIDARVTYTDNGKVATVKDGANNLTTYEYDGFDRSLRVFMPNPTKGAGTSNTADFEQVTLDNNGNVTSHRLRDNQVIGFTYDRLNRVTFKNLPNEPDVTYTYDNLARVKSANQSGNNLSFTWDALGRNLTQTGPHQTVTSAWDVAGRRTQLTYPGSGLYVNYDYLVTGETTKIRENGATSGVGVLASYAYDNLGRRSSVTFGNGAVQAFGFDAVSRLASLSNNLAGTTSDLTATFTNNAAGQIKSTSRTGDPYAWTDAVAVNRNYTSNGLNQYTSAGGVSFTYDGRGNLKSDGTSSFVYSSQNQLTSVTQGTATTSLAYDPAMRLYQVTGPTTTKFAYDGLDAIAEYDGANTLLRRYVHGPGMDEPIVWYEGAGLTDRRFLSADERGSIISSSNSTGAKLSINSYDEYGIPGSSNTGRFQYTGQMWLDEIGLYHYKARAYSPTLGRFMQTDPIGFEGGMNLYGYVGNDPVNYVDPLGLVASNGPAPQSCDSNEYRSLATGQCVPIGPPIVVTGDRLAGMMHAWLFRDQLFGIARELVPGVGLYRCFRRGCSLDELAWGIADVTPVGKGINLGRKGLQLLTRACGCLEAGTLVSTPSGLAPIESLAVGDLVLSVNEQTGEIASKPITDLIRPEPKPLYKLSLRDAGGEAETFHATDDHPWKVEGKGWVETVKLAAGDRIDTASGADMVVTGLTLTDRVERTYNLTVADWHTFMVGEDRAVVHNACPPSLSKFWKSLQNWKGGVRRSGDRYYSYDRRHGEIEVFDKRGRHLGAVDPQTGQFTKGPVPGRSINVR